MLLPVGRKNEPAKNRPTHTNQQKTVTTPRLRGQPHEQTWGKGKQSKAVTLSSYALSSTCWLQLRPFRKTTGKPFFYLQPRERVRSVCCVYSDWECWYEKALGGCMGKLVIPHWISGVFICHPVWKLQFLMSINLLNNLIHYS